MSSPSAVEIPDAVRTSLLVAMLYEQEAKISALVKQHEATKKSLIERGKGIYADSHGRTATVVVPEKGASSVTLYPEADYKAFLEEIGAKKSTPELEKTFRKSREDQARALAGQHFLDLFGCVQTYVPRDGFAARADALLTPARTRDLVALCTSVKPAGAAYVKLNDKPKP